MFSKPTRNHISIIFERLGFVFFMLIIFGFNTIQNSVTEIFKPEFWRNLFDEATNINSISVVFIGAAILLIVTAVLVVSFRYWLKTVFYIEGQNFIFERTTLFKKHSKLPIANIATVNLERNIFERFMGTSKVKLDLNSSHTANRTDFAFVLKTPLAEELRSTLAAMKSGSENGTAQAQGIADVPANRETIISFSPSEVVRHKILSIPVFQGFMAMFFIFGTPYFDTSSAWDIKSAVNLALLTIAGGAAVMIWGMLNLSGYTVERDDKNFYINCGLIRKTSYTFEHEKVNAVFVKQPVLARIFRLYSIEVAVVGLGNEKAETPQLCLLVNKKQAERVLSLCAADFACKSAEIPSRKAALIPAAAQAAILSLLPLLLLFTYYSFTYQACGIVFAFSALGGWLAYKTKTIAYDDLVFHYSKGIFTKKKVMFKYGDIQDTRIKTNFLLRGMNAGRMSLNILSGAKMKAHKTGYFNLSDFEAVSSKVVEHADSSTGLFG